MQSVLLWDCSRISPLASTLHFSFAAPLQLHRMTLLRLPPFPWSFRHLPLCLNSLLLYCQFSAWSEPLHDQITTWARLAELLPLSSRHFPSKPLTGCTDDDPEVLGLGLGEAWDVKLTVAVKPVGQAGGVEVGVGLGVATGEGLAVVLRH